MRTFLAMIMIVAIAVPAFAGGNPDVVGYIDFDPPNRVHSAMPEAYTTVLAYICIGDLDMGMTGVAFMINDTDVDCPDVFAITSFTNLLPGDLAIGHYLTGISLASTECVTGPDVSVAYMEFFYIGGACCIELQDHPEMPGWVTDCNDPAQVDYYELIAHGSIGGATCPEITPVEAATWGSIKALYK